MQPRNTFRSCGNSSILAARVASAVGAGNHQAQQQRRPKLPATQEAQRHRLPRPLRHRGAKRRTFSARMADRKARNASASPASRIATPVNPRITCRRNVSGARRCNITRFGVRRSGLTAGGAKRSDGFAVVGLTLVVTPSSIPESSGAAPLKVRRSGGVSTL